MQRRRPVETVILVIMLALVGCRRTCRTAVFQTRFAGRHVYSDEVFVNGSNR